MHLSAPKCKRDMCPSCAKQALKGKAQLQIDSTVRQVIADGILPSVDIFNPRVIDGVSDSQNVEHFNGDKTTPVLGCSGSFPVVKQLP